MLSLVHEKQGRGLAAWKGGMHASQNTGHAGQVTQRPGGGEGMRICGIRNRTCKDVEPRAVVRPVYLDHGTGEAFGGQSVSCLDFIPTIVGSRGGAGCGSPETTVDAGWRMNRTEV